MTEVDFQEKWKWIDPDPKLASGVLLSDRIKFYVNAVHLINPTDFDEECLQYASYDLTVGDEYYHNDKKKRPDKNGRIVIPKNGLIFVKLKEKINIPYYMVAQHDLKVRQVYRGFLAGRSLQVDPGYDGHINYPIFNFTDEDKEIHVGDKITTMCFIKTTPFSDRNLLEPIQTEKQLRQTNIRGLNDHKCKTFEGSEDRPIPKYWYGGEKHKSTVEQIQSTLDRWKRRAWLTLLGVFVTIIIGVIGPIVYHVRWVSDKVIDISKEVSSVSSSLEQLRAELTQRSEADKTRTDETIPTSDNEEQLSEDTITSPAKDRGS